MDDLDNDGKRDIVYIGTDGVVRMARNNGTYFEPPVAILSLYSGRTTLRCVDWNSDGLNDILSVNISGAVRIALGTGTHTFKPDSLLFNVASGCTGAELVPDVASTTMHCYFGNSNGTITCVYQAAGNTRVTLPVRLPDGTPVDAGDDANLTSLDIDGDNRFELLVGNSAGSVETYTLIAADTVRSLGKLTAGGIPLVGTGGIFLSATYGDFTGDLPKIVYSDGNGALFSANSALRGDVNNDGVADVLDLQQLGIHWGQRSSEAGWSGMANLNVTAATSESQVINVLDLQVLGNCWGLRR
jgi:hypothetical protein